MHAGGQACVSVAVVLEALAGKAEGARYCREFRLNQENAPAARDASELLLQKLFNLSEAIL